MMGKRLEWGVIMTKAELKNLLFSLGAELCGVAPVERFDAAPKGFHPLDVWPQCKTVVAFACRMPTAVLSCHTPAVYTRVRNSAADKMDAIALNACIELEKAGIRAVPIPANESVWDGKTGRNRSIVSLKHAAQAAGLGSIGRHSLLITPQLGSMVWLGAVLTDGEWEGDPVLEPICTGCRHCVEACPVNALAGEQIDQGACWGHAFGDDPEIQRWVISCHKCRDACPNLFGTDNTF